MIFDQRFANELSVNDMRLNLFLRNLYLLKSLLNKAFRFVGKTLSFIYGSATSLINEVSFSGSQWENGRLCIPSQPHEPTIPPYSVAWRRHWPRNYDDRRRCAEGNRPTIQSRFYFPRSSDRWSGDRGNGSALT